MSEPILSYPTSKKDEKNHRKCSKCSRVKEIE